VACCRECRRSQRCCGDPKFSEGATALNLTFSPVAYFTELEAHDVINGVIQNVAMNVDFLKSIPRQMLMGTIFNMLVAGVSCLKHEGFAEEREWRAIYSPSRLPSSLMESSTELIGGVPQIVHKIPLDVTASPVLAELDLTKMFDRLIIGPSPYPLVMVDAFRSALKAAGIQDAEMRVYVSGIPIRR
jgi:hypothetical protein